jgi:hypothetical protein
MNCIIKGCGKEARARGLCDCDYVMALRLIKQGKVKWSDLELMEMAKPARKRGATSKFLEQFNIKFCKK